jgi:hypothetical protein
MADIVKEVSGVKAPVYCNYIVVTPRRFYPPERLFVTHLKRFGNTAVLDGVAKRSLHSLREWNTDALVTHCTT